MEGHVNHHYNNNYAALNLKLPAEFKATLRKVMRKRYENIEQAVLNFGDQADINTYSRRTEE